MSVKASLTDQPHANRDRPNRDRGDTVSTDLDPIADSVADLGTAVSRQLVDARRSLHTRDLTLADQVVRNDSRINESRWSLEERVVEELGRGVSSADRLRFLIAVLSVINDLERMGDHCEGIAKVALMLGSDDTLPLPADLARLGDMVQVMLDAGLSAFAARDAESARTICTDDDAVDALYDGLNGQIFAAMTADRDAVVSHTYLLWVTHNLERIADRVTNVCERTVYLVTGRLDELNVSNY